MIMFTGSTQTGRKVAAGAAERLIPVSLELGGKDPMIVCADADLDRAANAAATWGLATAARSARRSSASTSSRRSTTRSLTSSSAPWTSCASAASRRGEADVGAMTFPPQIEIVERHVADAVAKGAKVLTGGRRANRARLLLRAHHPCRCRSRHGLHARGDLRPTLPVMKVRDTDEASGWRTTPGTASRLPSTPRTRPRARRSRDASARATPRSTTATSTSWAGRRLRRLGRLRSRRQKRARGDPQVHRAAHDHGHPLRAQEGHRLVPELQADDKAARARVQSLLRAIIDSLLDCASVGVTDGPLLAEVRSRARAWSDEPAPARGGGGRPSAPHARRRAAARRPHRLAHRPRYGGMCGARRNPAGAHAGAAAAGAAEARRPGAEEQAFGDPPAARLAALLPLPRDDRDAAAGGPGLPRPSAGVRRRRAAAGWWVDARTELARTSAAVPRQRQQHRRSRPARGPVDGRWVRRAAV